MTKSFEMRMGDLNKQQIKKRSRRRSRNSKEREMMPNHKMSSCSEPSSDLNLGASDDGSPKQALYVLDSASYRDPGSVVLHVALPSTLEALKKT